MLLNVYLTRFDIDILYKNVYFPLKNVKATHSLFITKLYYRSANENIKFHISHYTRVYYQRFDDVSPTEMSSNPILFQLLSIVLFE